MLTESAYEARRAAAETLANRIQECAAAVEERRWVDCMDLVQAVCDDESLPLDVDSEEFAQLLRWSEQAHRRLLAE